jgi:GNAT superfamily N-acetyltransferase
MKLRKCTREEFSSQITDKDGFAKTFVAKANMQEQWDYCMGAWDGDELMGAIITTVNKRDPKVANLQLLHTFFKHRGKGVGKVLTDYALDYAIQQGAVYFRVSAEPDAVKFYEKCGFTFWGLQKSGCSLSIFKIKDNIYTNAIYDENDPVIRKALYSGRKGSLASSYEEKKSVDIYSLLG